MTRLKDIHNAKTNLLSCQIFLSHMMSTTTHIIYGRTIYIYVQSYEIKSCSGRNDSEDINSKGTTSPTFVAIAIYKIHTWCMWCVDVSLFVPELIFYQNLFYLGLGRSPKVWFSIVLQKCKKMAGDGGGTSADIFVIK